SERDRFGGGRGSEGGGYRGTGGGSRGSSGGGYGRRDDRQGGGFRGSTGSGSDRRDDRPRSFDRDDRPRRDFQQRDDRPRRDFQSRDDRPRRDFQQRDDRPRRDSDRRDDRPRSFDRDDRPRRDFQPRDDRPRRDFQQRDERPRRDFHQREDPPRRDFQPRDDRPRRDSQQRDDRPRRDFQPRDDRPRSFDRRDDRPTDRGGFAGREDRDRDRFADDQQPLGVSRDEPALDDDITADELDKPIRAELVSLARPIADRVARHLVAAGRYLDEDPELSYEHAVAARRMASRIGVVREAVGLAAYKSGQWQTAVSELRTYHRMSGKQTHLAILADCERALGRPERAIDLYRSAERQSTNTAETIELLI